MNLKNCPKCKTKGSIRQILWGMPDFDNPPDPNKYVSGGCLVSGFDPTHVCIKCGWQKMPKGFEPGFDSGLDETWKNFYSPDLPDDVDSDDEPKFKADYFEDQKRMIHFAFFYNGVASTGTKTPIYDAAARIGCSIEEVGELMERCFELNLLNKPKRGSYRCELSGVAVRLIAKMGIGL